MKPRRIQNTKADPLGLEQKSHWDWGRGSSYLQQTENINRKKKEFRINTNIDCPKAQTKYVMWGSMKIGSWIWVE